MQRGFYAADTRFAYPVLLLSAIKRVIEEASALPASRKLLDSEVEALQFRFRLVEREFSTPNAYSALEI